MAYYGPNADSLGNIKLTMWQYKAITDINQLIQNLCILAGIDLLSGFFNAILLWTTCKINVFKVLKGIQKDLWLIMGVQEAFFFVQVKNITKYDSQQFPYSTSICKYQIIDFFPQMFGQTNVGTGNDLTLKFNWIHGEYALNYTSPIH